MSAVLKNSGSTRPAWEQALRALNNLLCRASIQDARRVSDECEQAMRECIRHGKPSEALQAYGAVCSSGMYDSPSSAPPQTQARPTLSSSATALDLKSMDQLAVIALQMCPNRSLQSRAVAELVAAEMDNDFSASGAYFAPMYQPMQPVPVARTPFGEQSARTSHPNRDDRRSNICSSSRTMMGAAHIHHFPAPASRISPSRSMAKLVNVNATQAELFRVQLRQHLFLLRSTGILQEVLGRNYLLTQARQVVTDRRLRRVVEVESLVAIGMELLNHPLVFQKPSTAQGRRQLLFEDIGVFSRSDFLSAAQQEKIRSLEASVSPTRSACSNPLEFVHVLVQSWDDIFLERLTATYVTPSNARNVMPHRPSAKQPVIVTTSRRLEETSEPKAQEEVSAGLFAAHRGDKEWTVEARIHRILRARRFHDVVVPDCAFVLNNFPQLVQLARHREVILTHTTLLGLAEACSDGAGPRRFHARKVLSHFLNEARAALASSSATHSARQPTREGKWERVTGSRAPWVGGGERRSPFRCGGVTILGLQDELAMLDSAEERALGAVEGSHHWRCAVVCKQLERTLAALDDEQRGILGCSRRRTRVSSAPAAKTKSTGSDSLDHIISNLFLDEEDVVKNEDQKECRKAKSSVDAHESAPPLFSQRGQRTTTPHGSSAVVLATTATDTRQIAFSIGQRLFPPVSSA